MLVVAFTAALAAQQRVPMNGKVVDGNGAPVCGARIVLVEDDAEIVAIDPVDVVSCTSDDRGRFTAPLLRGVRYTALASSEETEGRAFVAKPVRDLGCHMPAEVVLGVVGHRRRYTLPALAKWGTPAELGVRVQFAGCPGHFVEGALGDDGSFELPPLAAVGSTALFTRDGRELSGIGLPTDPKQPALLNAPFPITVRVVDRQGAPVGKVCVEVELIESGTPIPRRGEVAVTDGDGRASVRALHWRDPFLAAPDTMVLRATKPGYEEGVSGWIHGKAFVDWGVVPGHRKNEVRIVMRAAKERTAHTVGRVLAHRSIDICATARIAMGDGVRGWFDLERRYTARVQEDGSIDVPELAPSIGEIHVRMPPLDGKRVIVRSSNGTDLPALDVGDCRPFAVQVLDENRGPATFATLLVVPADCTDKDVAHSQPLTLDRAGRAHVLLQPGTWTVFAATPTTLAMQEIEVVDDPLTLTLALAAKPSMTVRVVDANGDPVANARFEVGIFRVPFGDRREPLFDALGWNHFGEHVRRGRTDERGESKLWFLPWPGVTPTAYAWLGSLRRRSPDFAVSASAEPVVVVLPR